MAVRINNNGPQYYITQNKHTTEERKERTAPVHLYIHNE